MEFKYVGLKIYNNFSWKAALQSLENNNYTWVSGDKPTSLYYNHTQGIIFINIKTKTITKSPKVTATADYHTYYIEVK